MSPAFPLTNQGATGGAVRIMISWIKLDINILDDAKIKIIRSHPDGNAMVVLWIGLLCLAMKSQRPGLIEISNALPYTLDDISNLFNIEKKTCELGLVLFKKYRMIDLMDDGAIEILNFSKHQKIEEIERKNELTRLRVARHREKQRSCNALLTHNGVTVTPTDKDKDKDKDNTYTPAFAEFWSAYPRKTAKREAWKVWSKLNGGRPNLEAILSAIALQKKSPEWKKENGRFIPHPATWLRQGRWEDEIKVRTDPFN